MVDRTTTAQVKRETKQDLDEVKRSDESMDDVLNRLIKEQTRVQLTTETYKRLKQQKGPNETIEDVITRLSKEDK